MRVPSTIVSTIATFCVSVSLCWAQTSTADQNDAADSLLAPNNDYRIELHLIGGAGFTIYNQAPTSFSQRNVFFGYNANVRIMWHPNHLLSAGLMSGYQIFSRQRFDVGDHPDVMMPTTLELTSIPLHLAFEVRPMQIRFGAGLGIYFLQSRIKEDQTLTVSTDIAFGGSAWLGYTFALSDRLRFGPDIVGQFVSDRGISNFSAMVTVEYDLFVY